MSLSYQDAYNRLLDSREKLASQDITVLPRQEQIRLLQAQQAVYSEIQAFLIDHMTDRKDRFSILTEKFRHSRRDFQDIRQWAVEASKTGEMVGGLLKGVSLALTLL